MRANTAAFFATRGQMWGHTGGDVDWRQRAPRWVSVLLSGLILAELARVGWVLHSIAAAALPAGGAVPPTRRGGGVNVRGVVNAHLFGAPSRNEIPGNAPPTQLALALTGVIATQDPNAGYAILGERGKPGRLYRTEPPLGGGAGAKLVQVFADHVVLDVGGRLETVSLPHQSPSGGLRVATAARGVKSESEENQQDSVAREVTERLEQPPTAAESALAPLNLEPAHAAAGGVTGMILHPEKRYQREYGLREGDVLTAVNGVEVTDPEMLQQLLKSASSLTMTLVHDGSPRVVNMRLSQ